MTPYDSSKVFAFAATVLLGAACSTSAQQPKTPGPTDVVATVGAVTITLEQVDRKALEEPAETFGDMKLSQAIYEARRAAVDDIVGNILLDQEARRLGVERAALAEQEINSKVKAVTEAEIAAWYQTNKQRVKGATLDQVRAPIQSLLTQERIQAARTTYLETLQARTPVRVMIEPPRAVVNAGKSPAKGAASAPIEIIEFADFECPYCIEASPTVKRVLDTYGDRVRLVYRNYPLRNHPRAKPAAEAAQCAHEQDQFWAYHDRLFGEPGKLSDADLKQTAVTLGLNAAQFNKCVDDRKYQSIVETDAKAGVEAGVNGTPAFFINGRLLTGAQPFEAFKRIIDDEIALKKN